MGLIDHLDKLRAFAIAAETGTLREAAARLNLTQPSLTRLIQTLEQAVGQTLFHRSRQGVVLTESGQVLLEFARKMLKETDDVEERMRSPGDDLAGLMRIGSYETLAEYFWPDFIHAARRQHPRLKIAIKTDGAAFHRKALETGLLDMLVDAEPRLRGEFTSWVLYEDRFAFYGKRGSFPDALTPETARACPLIFCPAATDQDNKSILQHMEEAGYGFSETIELDSFTAVATFARKGLGIGVLPQRLAASQSAGLAPLALKGFASKGFGPHSICATVSSASAGHRRVRHIVKMLRAWFRAQ